MKTFHGSSSLQPNGLENLRYLSFFRVFCFFFTFFAPFSPCFEHFFSLLFVAYLHFFFLSFIAFYLYFTMSLGAMHACMGVRGPVQGAYGVTGDPSQKNLIFCPFCFKLKFFEMCRHYALKESLQCSHGF